MNVYKRYLFLSVSALFANVSVAKCDFSVGTKITMANGSLKSIEDVTTKDSIKVFNFRVQRIVDEKIKSITSSSSNDLIKIILSDNTFIISTSDQSYFILDKGWSSYKPDSTKRHYDLDAKQLSKGDIVYKYLNGVAGKVQIKEILPQIKDTKQTYKVVVEQENCFFAGNILVDVGQWNATSQVGVFEKYNESLKLYNERVKLLSEKMKIDTMLLFSTDNMDSAKCTFEKSIRSYIIYKYKGEIYVDYVNYIKPFVYDKAQISISNKFPDGANVFNYYYSNNIIGVLSVPLVKERLDEDNLSGYGGLITYGNNAYDLGYLEKFNVEYGPAADYHLSIKSVLNLLQITVFPGFGAVQRGL